MSGHIDTFFWNMPVEDNGFLLLKTAQGQVAWLHASCTEWKNLFCFEIFGRNGKNCKSTDWVAATVSSAYRSIACYRKWVPETTIWEYPGEDSSWRDEYAHFLKCIREHQQP